LNTGRSIWTPLLKALALATVCLFVGAIVASGGCSSSSTASTSPTQTPTVAPSGSPTPTPSPTPTANYFVAMEYPSVPPTTDPVYGAIQGYASLATAPAQSPSPSPVPTISAQLVTVHCNKNIEFYNLDRLGAHTASSLGAADGMNWPATFNNPNGITASPLLTAISYPGFSSGSQTAFLSSGWFSLVYSTGNVAGTFYFGDKYEYLPLTPGWPHMRTVLTILCP
jgi:hypothetical protein